MYLIVGFEVVSERVSRAASFDVPVSDARPGSSEQAVDVARVLGGVSVRNEFLEARVATGQSEQC